MEKVLQFRGKGHTTPWKPTWNSSTWGLETEDPWNKLVKESNIWRPCLKNEAESGQERHLTSASGLRIHICELVLAHSYVPTHLNTYRQHTHIHASNEFYTHF